MPERHSWMDHVAIWIVWLLPALACALALLLIGPPPPSTLRVAAGATDGAYFDTAQRLARALQKKGVRLTVVPTSGAETNLLLIKSDRPKVDVALVQGGLATPAQRVGLVSAGRLFYEPVWIFYRSGLAIRTIADLQGRRIAVGENGSGTRVLAEQVLATHRIDAMNTELLQHGFTQAGEELKSGAIDAAFVVASERAPGVRAMLAEPSITILSLPNAKAYEKHMPHLTNVVLPRGGLDLAADRPPADVSMVAASAALIVRKDLHPALGYLLAEAAHDVSQGAGLLHKEGEFPRAHDPEFEMAEAAKRLYRHGAPFLHRYLSFWVADFVERSLSLVLPLAAVVLPLLRGFWWLYDWMVRQRITRWYAELRRIDELALSFASWEQDMQLLEACDRLGSEVRQRRLPTAFAEQVYGLEVNIGRLRRQIVERQRQAVQRLDTA